MEGERGEGEESNVLGEEGKWVMGGRSGRGGRVEGERKGDERNGEREKGGKGKENEMMVGKDSCEETDGERENGRR